MNWQAIAAAAELLAAVGVVVSLIYLALQVRQNTEQMRLNSESLRMAHEMGGARMSVDVAMAVATDPGLSDLMGRASTEPPPDLSQGERVRFGNVMYAALAGFQAGYYNYEKGLAPAGAWKGHEGDLRETMRSTTARRWWSRARGRFSPRFARYVDGLLHGEKGAGTVPDE